MKQGLQKNMEAEYHLHLEFLLPTQKEAVKHQHHKGNTMFNLIIS